MRTRCFINIQISLKEDSVSRVVLHCMHVHVVIRCLCFFQVYLRYRDPIKSYKSGDPVIDKDQRYVITDITATEPLPSYRLRQYDFPYASFNNSFDESRLIGVKDLAEKEGEEDVVEEEEEEEEYDIEY